jgi:hypothetical protein
MRTDARPDPAREEAPVTDTAKRHPRRSLVKLGLFEARVDIRGERIAMEILMRWIDGFLDDEEENRVQFVNGRLCDPALRFITRLISVASCSC